MPGINVELSTYESEIVTFHQRRLARNITDRENKYITKYVYFIKAYRNKIIST